MTQVNELRELELQAMKLGMPTPQPVLEASHKLAKEIMGNDAKEIKKDLLEVFLEAVKSSQLDDNQYREKLTWSFQYTYQILESIEKAEAF